MSILEKIGTQKSRPQRAEQNAISAAPKRKEGFRVEFGPSRKDILNFTNQLAVMLRAGISLQDALESIGSQIQKHKFRVIVMDLKLQIEAGKSFSQALSEHPEVFNNLYINMVAAAEISGSMSSMLQQLSEYLDQEADTRSQVVSAMVYPIIIAVMAVTCVTFLLTFVLPRFLTVFAGKEHLLPTPTKIIMMLSGGLREYWFIVFPAIGAAIMAFWYLTRKTRAGKAWWDRGKLQIPLLKTLCRSLYITRSMHTMGVLTNAGVPILDTLSITSQITGNTLYENMWKGVYEEVRQGKKIAASLGQYNLMPGNVVQMIQSGEESGTIGDVLNDISEFYARELRTVIKTVTSMIEPIMIVVMGVLVGFIAMSIILPIFKMSSVVTS
ncbi:MAG TPA: type II secretion system F family protein [Anaerohalosphaeraceae bacterium]|jgi:type IV pilus assembly protein PilC|nr:type II secretion system F family protein [Anaerohalosphaeraceae bacterium]